MGVFKKGIKTRETKKGKNGEAKGRPFSFLKISFGHSKFVVGGLLLHCNINY